MRRKNLKNLRTWKHWKRKKKEWRVSQKCWRSVEIARHIERSDSPSKPPRLQTHHPNWLHSLEQLGHLYIKSYFSYTSTLLLWAACEQYWGGVGYRMIKTEYEQNNLRKINKLAKPAITTPAPVLIKPFSIHRSHCGSEGDDDMLWTLRIQLL